MAMAESVRAKAEEFRSKIRSRVEEIRAGSSSSEHSPLLGKMGLLKGGGLLKGTLVTDIREKGLLTTARAKIETVRGGGGILGHSSPAIGEKVSVEKDTGALKQYRKKLAIEA